MTVTFNYISTEYARKIIEFLAVYTYQETVYYITIGG